jgi:hypothetical protein
MKPNRGLWRYQRKALEKCFQANFAVIVVDHLQVQFWDPPTGGPSRPQLFGKLSRPHPFGYLLYKPAAPGAAAEAAQPYKTFNVSRIGGDLTVQKLAALWPLASEIAAPTSTARGACDCG